MDRCDDHDDKKKNGIKTFIFGKKYWFNINYLSNQLNEFDSTYFADFVKFFFSSTQSLIPCQHCRKSVKGHLKKPEYDICIWMDTRTLPQFSYFLHNAVNSALGVKPEDSQIMMNYENVSEEKYEEMFWGWIIYLAFNFPADINFTDYWNGISTSPFGSYTQNSKEGVELTKRLKAYVTFFDLIKNFLPRDSKLLDNWIQAYTNRTPTLITFSSKTKLLAWVFEMARECHMKFDTAPKTTDSLISFLNQLHPTRSAV